MEWSLKNSHEAVLERAAEGLRKLTPEDDDRIPWAALKSAWRRAAPMICQNCDTPIILANFGNPWVGMFNRSPRVVYVCGACCRSFRDDSVKDVTEWLRANLDPEVRPGYEMVWDRRVKCESRS